MPGYGDVLNAQRGMRPAMPQMRQPTMRRPPVPPAARQHLQKAAKKMGGCPGCGGKMKCKNCGKEY